MKKLNKLITHKIKRLASTLKSIALGDSKNSNVKYMDKRAIGELRTMSSLRDSINKKYQSELLTNRLRSKTKRRYLAANTKMSTNDEKLFFKKRNKRINQLLAGAGLVIPMGTPLIGLAALNANKKNILDQRYNYMKSKGYV